MARIMRVVALWHVASPGGRRSKRQKYTRVATGLEPRPPAPLQHAARPLRKRCCLRASCVIGQLHQTSREEAAHDTVDTIPFLRPMTPPFCPPLRERCITEESRAATRKYYARNLAGRIVAITPLRGVSVKSGERSTF